MGRTHCVAALYTEASQIETIHGESHAGKGMCDLSVLRESSGALRMVFLCSHGWILLWSDSQSLLVRCCLVTSVRSALC